MKKIFLSVKPQYVNKILSGEKKYEYRRVIFRNQTIKHLLIYASYPIQRVVAECEIKSIEEGSLEEVWERTNQFGGITKEQFTNYFKGRVKAYAICLENMTIFKEPKELSVYHLKKAPMSFCYVTSPDE